MAKLIELLEPRTLYAGGFSASVNFAPLNAPRAPGLLTDYGATYDVRRGGLSYGWNADARAVAVDRNLTRVQKNDTFIAMQQGGNKAWEIGVENGSYEVYVVGGDPGATGDRMAITVEGEVAVSGITKSARRYLEGKVRVDVTDGRLTVGNAVWAVNNKLCYLSVIATEPAVTPTLNVAATVPLARESGAVGQFRVTRVGNVGTAVTVPFTVGGSATGGLDYAALGNEIHFAAGVDSRVISVKALADTIAESDETVTLTLGAVAGYTPVASSATVKIRDDASVPPDASTSVAWSTRSARPQAVAEPFGVAVGGSLYTFGGYVDNTYRPSRNAYAFDTAANSWTALAPLPVGNTQAGVAADDRYVYFGGGHVAVGNGQTFSTRAVYRYDTVANAYAVLPNLPAARGPGGMARVGRVLYFVGGSDASRNDVGTMWSLDLDNLDAGWVTRASLPAARNRFGVAVLGGKIYVVGGQTNYDNNAVFKNDVYRYDPSANTWTSLAPLPTDRSHNNASVFVSGGRVISAGGQGSGLAPLASVVAYNPSTNAWANLTGLPSARFSGVADVIAGKFVFTGGYNGGFRNTTYVGTLS